MPFLKVRVPVNCIAPFGSRRSKSGLPAPSTTGTTVTCTSSKSPSSANCEATPPPPTTQSTPVAGRGRHLAVELAHRRVGNPDVDSVALG